MMVIALIPCVSLAMYIEVNSGNQKEPKERRELHMEEKIFYGAGSMAVGGVAGYAMDRVYTLTEGFPCFMLFWMIWAAQDNTIENLLDRRYVPLATLTGLATFMYFYSQHPAPR